MSHVTKTQLNGRRLSLPVRLLAAAEWFDTAMSARMAAAGWPLLSRTQSLVFVSIDDEGTRPAELARRLGITRQSMQEVVRKLCDHGLLTVDVDPDDGRAVLVRLSSRAHRLGRDAAVIGAELERELASRIGDDALGALRDVLERDWGEPPADGPTHARSNTSTNSTSPRSSVRIGPKEGLSIP